MSDVKVPDIHAVMKLSDAKRVARFFQVLSDPTRVRIVMALAESEWCVTDLTDALSMDQPAVSHQLKYLREHGLVRWKKRGRHVYYSLDDTQLEEILMQGIEYLSPVS
jgi:DNA-binding transcriptional ArsR family regulator